MLAKLLKTSKAVNQFPGEVFWMRGDKAYPFYPAHAVYFREKLREGEVVLSLVVRVHVLPEEGHLFYPSIDQYPNLFQNIGTLPALLASTDIRYNAVAAVIVAAFHDRNKGLWRPDRSLRPHMQGRCAAVVRKIEKPLFPRS